MDGLFSPSDVSADAVGVDFTPTREAGLARLGVFAKAMGTTYSRERNTDYGPTDRGNVSALSPWVRARCLLERELVEAALERFSFSTAEKFIDEVCWRSYFKGWLEHRPAVWGTYAERTREAHDRLASDGSLRKRYERAAAGHTGLDAFDAWAKELVQIGYLHNHARMWFASIWIFTLKLPWELGADFFLQHLMDGDAASNTLSWRWVAGLHTPGKTYLARPSNIRKHTAGRFTGKGLVAEALPVEGDDNPPIESPREGHAPPDGEVALLVTEEDTHVETLRPAGATVKGVAGVAFPHGRSPAGCGEPARRFVMGVVDDALRRAAACYEVTARRLDAEEDLTDALERFARELQVDTIVAGFPPTGWVRPRLDGVRRALADRGVQLVYLQREWDRVFWPHATAGFFKLKKQIRGSLPRLGFAV